MYQREMVERLACLRREVEAEAGVSVVELETSFALALWDVCGALELTEPERATVLGQSADDCICGFLDKQIWPIELQAAVA
jgi:hypothetical protein